MSPPLHSTHVLVSSFATNNATGIALMTGSPRIFKDLEKFGLSTNESVVKVFFPFFSSTRAIQGLGIAKSAKSFRDWVEAEFG